MEGDCLGPRAARPAVRYFLFSLFFLFSLVFSGFLWFSTFL
jgi:hypothetical protein